ncbi:MAG: HAD family phosphatase [Myxococcales bacterium]|nr:HAD family phosphatase [Myxococcales bacterium]
MIPKPVGALIFDMDGLMIDSEPLWWSVERALAELHGRPFHDELASRCIGTGLANAIITMREEIALPVSVEDGVRWLVATFLSRLDELALKPGFVELLNAASAASIPVAVASSSTHALISAVLARFSLSSRFDAVISGQDVIHQKPAPDIFLKAAATLRVEPQRAVVLEDALAGVRAAVAAGVAVIAVPEQRHDEFTSLTPYVVRDLFAARELLGLS